MAEQQQNNPLAALFPSPPQFFESFTAENLNRIEDIRKAEAGQSSYSNEQGSADKGSTGYQLPVRIFDLPTELRFLQPPPPPADGKYRSFGDVYDLSEALPSLEAQGIQQLYTPPASPSPEDPTPQHHDRALILKRLSKSLLLNFLELMGIMSVNPSQYGEKIEDLRTMFINFHHLLNEYRPHQARESLILMMEDQVRRVNSEVEGIEKMKTKVSEAMKAIEATAQGTSAEINGFMSQLDQSSSTKGESRGTKEEGQARQRWIRLDESFC